MLNTSIQSNGQCWVLNTCLRKVWWRSICQFVMNFFPFSTKIQLFVTYGLSLCITYSTHIMYINVKVFSVFRLKGKNNGICYNVHESKHSVLCNSIQSLSILTNTAHRCRKKQSTFSHTVDASVLLSWKRGTGDKAGRLMIWRYSVWTWLLQVHCCCVLEQDTSPFWCNNVWM